MNSVPPPPPPPPPGGFASPEIMAPPPSPQDVAACRTALTAACQQLEQARCQHAELEALLHLGSHLLGDGEAEKPSSSVEGVEDSTAASTTPRCVQDVVQEIKAHNPSANQTFPPPGQWGKAVQTSVLAGSLQRAANLAKDLVTAQTTHGRALQSHLTTAQTALAGPPPNPHIWLQCLDERLAEIRSYHARHDEVEDVSNWASMERAQKRSRIASDGFDLVSTAQPWLLTESYPPNEVLGKYVDLQHDATDQATSLLQAVQVLCTYDRNNQKTADADKPLVYADLLQLLVSPGLATMVSESAKLEHRKVYGRFLGQLQSYLTEHIRRTVPLLNVQQHIVEPADTKFVQEWRRTGGYAPGWPAKPAEAVMVITKNDNDKEDNKDDVAIDLSSFDTPDDLAKAVDGDRLKAELGRLGLKCGGTVLDRAKRLLLTKNKDRSEWPRKLFAKGAATTNTSTTRRVDLARQEATVTALLNQVRPTLEATLRRVERRQGQTLQERETEIEQDLYGSEIKVAKKRLAGQPQDDDEDEDDDDEDTPIYNPKNVPLDWDGKPIPYWLFKLHGLNHYYECEICGGESYRGRRNFELHFADPKHALGMKSLGIPNTKHFHGVTKIDDAKELWKRLQSNLAQEQFDSSTQEEYEDSHGNVLSRATYEDLARQGLL